MKISREIPTAAACLLAALLSACGVSDVTPGNQPAPFIVQVENASDARPQTGLQNAAVVYEYVTEGGVSRFSAIYTSSPNGKVGPIRSARLVTISLAKMYGGLLVYSGGSAYIKGKIQAAGIPHVDEDSANGDLFRDNRRVAPHNLYTDGTHLSEVATHVNAPAVSWSLWQRTSTSSVTGGKQITRVTVPVSDTENPVFTYDPSAGVWKRTESDTGTFVDAATRAPMAISTLVVQQVNIRPTAEVVDVNGQTGVDHDITGSGKAQVFTAGREFEATWRQDTSGPPTFKSDGGQVPIASGLVWICLVASGTVAA